MPPPRKFLFVSICVVIFGTGFAVRPILSMAYHQLFSPAPHRETRDLTKPVEERTEEHLELLAEKSKNLNSNIVCLGDSITRGWDGAEVRDHWKGCFGSYAINLGIAWDRIENVLWRVQNGALNELHPKVIVLMIGSNNLSRGDSPQIVAEGIRYLIKEIHHYQPKTQVLLLSILPREMAFEDRTRRAIRDTNELLEETKGDFTFLRCEDGFVHSDGTLNADLLPDGVHPSPQGYQVLAKNIKPTISAMIGK